MKAISMRELRAHATAQSIPQQPQATKTKKNVNARANINSAGKKRRDVNMTTNGNVNGSTSTDSNADVNTNPNSAD